MKLSKLVFLPALVMGMLGLMGHQRLAAQSYPNRVIKIIVPWPVAGPSDSMLRPVMDKLSAMLGQPIIMESRPGANGTIGTAFVAKAAPDGYTLLLSHAGPMAISPSMKGFKGYDPVKDFAPISQLTSSSMVLVVRNDLPVKNIKEPIEYSKSSPKKLNLGSVGAGSTTHLAAAMMAASSGLDYVHVPYKGSAPLVTDLLAGELDFTLVGWSAISAFLPGGKVRALAMSSAQRWPLNPDLPVIGETIPGFEANPWYALHAPAGTPKSITNLLSADIAKILVMPDVVAVFKQLSMQPTSSTPEQLEAKLIKDLAIWGPVARSSGMTMD